MSKNLKENVEKTLTDFFADLNVWTFMDIMQICIIPLRNYANILWMFMDQ